MPWTEELKKTVIAAYEAADPTSENSTEIVKELADEYEQSANGVRQVLVQAGVYKKKEVGAKTGTAKAGTSDKAPRVSKESQIAELKALIEAKGQEVDSEILDKFTGKACTYLVKVFS